MKLEYILMRMKNGAELYISNHMHCWKINQKTVDKFDKLNHPVLIEKSDGLYMASGKKYVSIKYCKLEFLDKLNAVISICPNCKKIDAYASDGHSYGAEFYKQENEECSAMWS